jgi:hypothetical protein
MGSGSVGIGGVPVELHTHGPQRHTEDTTLDVRGVWSPDENAIELGADVLDQHIVLTDQAALELASLLVRAVGDRGSGGTVNFTAGHLAGRQFYLVPAPVVV